MEKKTGKFLSAKIESGIFICAVREGLVMIIPVLMVGSFALILKSFPMQVYLDFINSFASGVLYTIFDIVYKTTFGMLSVYMTIAVGYSMTKDFNLIRGGALTAPICSVSVFMILTGFGTDFFSVSIMGPVGMFSAIISALFASRTYIFICYLKNESPIFSDGSDPDFNRAVSAIFPLGVTLLIFAIINYFLCRIFNVMCFWGLMEKVFIDLFSSIGENFFGGLLYILSSSLMWFCGIHGSNVLESVNVNIFTPASQANVAAVAAGLAPTEIYTKTFFDVFVLMGGCGTLLSLLIAILLFSRRKSNRSLAKIAAFPMLFNINELMVFGLPIIYNPIMFIPFILAPLSSFLISSAAMNLGLVPLTSYAVEWTTPIILGGMWATGSASGAVLQVVNLLAGTLIYMPFVRLYDRKKQQQAEENMESLVELLKAHEDSTQPVMLTEIDGTLGDIAKLLVNDLKKAFSDKHLHLVYQPQFDNDKNVIGAEALVRWDHQIFGLIYPPLIIKLASEAGMLEELERNIFLMAKNDCETYNLKTKISINVTAKSIRSEAFINFLMDTFPHSDSSDLKILIEITEQSALIANETMTSMLIKLKEHGFGLAIDDFSMGHTSLKYLQDIEFDLVKLDGSLIKNLTADSKSKEIIASIVFLSKSLGFSVLAEFVETERQREILKELGCLKYQGYLFSPAIYPDELHDYMEKHDSNQIKA